MSIAIIWQRFGPYHLARLQGTSCILEGHACQCTGIEIAGRDQYAWHSVRGRHITLFPAERYETLSRRRIRQAVDDCLQQLNPAAVAVNGWSVPEALAATRWCVRRGRPAILMSETHERSPWRWKELWKRWRVRRCAAALVGGSWQADYLKSLGFPASRIVSGYDAVDNAHFEGGARQARRQASELRLRYGLPESYFFANTRFLPRKNVDGLLRAYALYAQTSSEHPRPWQLVISGDGEMGNAWKALASSLGINDSVFWPGFVQYDELPVYYGLASAFVHVAHREAWGLVVNEAAAAGLPLILGKRVGASCELVEDGKNGVLVEAGDSEQLAEAMIRIAQLDDGQRRKLGQHSQRLVSRFGPEQFGQSLWRAWQLAQREPVRE